MDYSDRASFAKRIDAVAPACISALTTVSGKPVINYLWEFGDGTTGSGATPTHTYAKPGSYKVTAVLFSGVGSAFPGDGAGPVYQQKITIAPGLH